MVRLVDAIGLASVAGLTLGGVSFGQDQFAQNQTGPGSVVKIAVGLDQNHNGLPTDAGGDLPDVWRN